MNPSPSDWSVECKPSGRDGYFFYHEDSREIPFCWEYGGGDTVVIVRIDEPAKFGLRYPWAIERKVEILERVAQEVVRQRAPSCVAVIDEPSLCVYVREKNNG